MRNKILPVLGTIMLCSVAALAQENKWISARPDGHAPINVMADHIHKKGEFMVSYRFMSMRMDGNIQGTNDIASEVILENFMVAPQQMQMSMHMLGLMYAPSDRVTLMLMGNYLSNSMDLKTRMGMEFTTSSSGLSDLNASALIGIMNNNRQSLHGQIGISIPTGDIDQRDATPMSDDAQLAYPMQLGSGTWDPTIGLTYLGQADIISWGAQSKLKTRVGENSEEYTFGNRFDLMGWGAVKVSNSFSLSTSLSYFNTEAITGVDEDLNPMMMPLFNTANSGRSQMDFGVGTNFYVAEGSLHNLRLAAEIKVPVSQNANGIQMKNGLTATFGIQYAVGH